MYTVDVFPKVAGQNFVTKVEVSYGKQRHIILYTKRKGLQNVQPPFDNGRKLAKMTLLMVDGWVGRVGMP